MTFDEIYDAVLVIVKRPDLQTRIQSAIRLATLKAHQSDFYYKDIVEEPIILAAPVWQASFDPKDIWPNFRKPKYLREWLYDGASPTFGREGVFLKFIDIENSIDGYGYNKTDVAYLAGSVIQIKSSCARQYYLGGAYVLPDVSIDNYASWIADEHPAVIIYETARQIFMQTGKQQDAQNMSAAMLEETHLMSIDSVNKPGE